MIKERWPRSSCSTFLVYILVRFFLTSAKVDHNNNDLLAVPSTSQLLILSPMTPKYTIHNTYLNVSTTVTTKGFDSRSVQAKIPKGAAAYVKSVTVNGVVQPSRCHFDFYDVFRVGGEVEIEVTSDKNSVDDCGASIPESLSTGGFAVAR